MLVSKYSLRYLRFRPLYLPTILSFFIEKNKVALMSLVYLIIHRADLILPFPVGLEC